MHSNQPDLCETLTFFLYFVCLTRKVLFPSGSFLAGEVITFFLILTPYLTFSGTKVKFPLSVTQSSSSPSRILLSSSILSHLPSLFVFACYTPGTPFNCRLFPSLIPFGSHERVSRGFRVTDRLISSSSHCLTPQFLGKRRERNATWKRSCFQKVLFLLAELLLPYIYDISTDRMFYEHEIQLQQRSDTTNKIRLIFFIVKKICASSSLFILLSTVVITRTPHTER